MENGQLVYNTIPDGNYIFIIKTDWPKIRLLKIDNWYTKHYEAHQKEYPYVTYKPLSQQPGHSSFISPNSYISSLKEDRSGTDVYYAGELTIQNSEIIEWSNASGHYMPDYKKAHKTRLNQELFVGDYY